MGREREQQIRKWEEKERGRVYIVAVERNNKKIRGVNILLKYLIKYINYYGCFVKMMV